MHLRNAAESLVSRARARGRRGRTLTSDELQTLNRALDGVYPQWLADLLASVPLCGLELGWQAYPPESDFDGVEWLEWSDAAGVISESLECYPGLAILPAGFINIGSCSSGSGDPYFVSVHEGEDPPLYHVYHDVSDRAEVILNEGCLLVAPHLSEFLASALLSVD
jgi:hypothetical protein